MQSKVRSALGVCIVVVICLVMTVDVQAKAKAKKYVKSIKVKSNATITIPVNKKTVTKAYAVTVKVKGKASKKFTAKSSKPSVASVKVSGKKIKVTAKKSGIAKITVKTKAKNKKGKKLSKKLLITVKKKTAPSYEGKITEKKLNMYAYVNGQIVSEELPVYFSSKYPDVPFVTDSKSIRSFLEITGYDSMGEAVTSANGMARTYKLPMGTSVSFDYGSKLMIFSDYTSTLVLNGDFMPFNPFGASMSRAGEIYKVSDSDLYHGGDPIAVTFSYDEVPMLKNGKDFLIPLQTFSDFFMSYTGRFLNYNGKGVFMIDNSLAKHAENDPGTKEYYDMYWKDATKMSKISSALAQVNYYELCNILEARYGLQKAHNIASFDEYFTRMGFKEKLLSADTETIEKTTQDISTMLFEDFHSGPGIQSVFLPNKISYEPVESPVFTSRNKKQTYLYNLRAAEIGEVPGEDDFPAYQKSDDGKTVFITFDTFNFNALSSYIDPAYEPKGDPNDTVDLFAYALKRLQNEDAGVKNVVIDISVNGGGTVLACGYAMQAICGQCNINIQNPITWALHQCALDYDLNFDGKYDDNDKSMLDLGKNVAVLISDYSFSSANLLPNALDQLDDRILLIGQQSGGGACSVGYISTAVGSTMQISGENRLSTMKNGYIRDIDNGIAPDVFIPLNKMFNRDHVAKLVGDEFGTNGE
jgi:hypothetical protein